MATGSGTGTPAVPLSRSLQTLVDKVRWRINNYEPPYLWSDAELVAYTNEIMKRFCFETRILIETTDTSICHLSLTEDTYDYAISDRIITVESARLYDSDNEGYSLNRKSFGKMDASNPDWREDDSDQPTTIVTDFQHGYVSFWPKPDASYTCKMKVIRLHKTDFTSTNMSGQVLEIPDMYTSCIAEGVAAMALLKSGESTYDPKKSQIHEAVFRGKMHEAKLHVLRLNSHMTFNKPMKGNT